MAVTLRALGPHAFAAARARTRAAASFSTSSGVILGFGESMLRFAPLADDDSGHGAPSAAAPRLLRCLLLPLLLLLLRWRLLPLLPRLVVAPAFRRSYRTRGFAATSISRRNRFL